MPWDNLHVKTLIEELQANWEKGFWDGLDPKSKALESFDYKLPMNWKPYERGYWFGRELKRLEEANGWTNDEVVSEG